VGDSTRSWPEPFRLGACLFGLAFIGIGLMGMLGVDGENSAWIWAALVGSIGVAGLVSVIEQVVGRTRR
jgi:hypothetical protein